MMTSRLVLRGLALLFAITLALASCSDKGLLSTDSEFARIMLVPAPGQLDDGASASVTVVGVQVGGHHVTLAQSRYSIQWTSSNPDVVQVEGTGNEVTLRAVAPGRANVSVDVVPLRRAPAASGSFRTSNEIVSTAVPVDFTLESSNNLNGRAGTILAESVTVRLVDRRGQGVAGEAVDFQVLEGQGDVSSATAMSDGDGLARTAWRLGQPGRNRLRIRPRRPDRHIDVDANGQEADPDAVRISAGNQQQGVVGQPLPNRLSVRVTDTESRPVPGVVVSWNVLKGGGTIAPQAAPTDDQGVSTVYWTLGATAGSQMARAAIGNLSAEFSATARAGAATRLVKLAGDGQTAAMTTQLRDSLSVQVVDQHGNAVSGSTVNWSVQSGGGTVSPAAVTTGASGVAGAVWTMGPGAGPATARATLAGMDEEIFSATASSGGGTPVPPSNTIVKLTGDAQSAAIATRLTDSLKVRVQNPQGVGVGGVTVTFAVTTGGGTVSPQTRVSDANGVAGAAWTMGPAAGPATLKASAPGAGEVNFGATATASSGGTGQLTITKVFGDAQTGAATTRLTDSLVVQVKNAQGAGVPGVTVTWTVQSGGGSVSPVTFTTNVNGFARTAWTLGPSAGAGSVQANAPNAAAPVTFTSTANAAPTVGRIVIAPAADTIEALNAQVTLTATAFDGSNQAMPGTRLSWRSLSPTVATVDTMGRVIGRAVGRALIVVSATCCTAADTATVDVIQRIALLDVSPATASVQIGSTSALTATARDANNNVIASPVLTWSSSSNTIATVNTSGLVTGSGVGTAVIRAVAGTVRDSAVVTVTALSGGALANECATPAGAWVWCDDFNQDRMSSYFEHDAAGGSFVRATGVGVDGTGAMRARFAAGQVNAGSLKLAFGRTPSSYFRPADAGTSNYRELYWRVFLRNQPGWTGGGGDKLARMIIFANSNWSEALIAHFWSGGTGGNYLVIDPASGTDAQGNVRTTTYNDFDNLRWLGGLTGSTPLFANSLVGEWICLESHVRVNDAGQSNGLYEFWINGALEGRLSNLNWVGSYDAYGLNAFLLENYWNNGSPQQQERYLDNLVVSTAPIGCSGGGGSGPAPVSSVSVGPANPTVQVNGTLQLSATTRDAAGNLLTGRSVSWSTGNATVATVSTSGLVTGRAAGTAVITATSEGRTGTTTVTVPTAAPDPVATVTVTPSGPTVQVGSTQQLTATLRNASGDVLTGRQVNWSSGSTSVATVSSSGLVTAVTAGTAVITATSEGRSGTTTATVPTVTPAPVASVTVAPSAATVQLGGTQQLTATLRDAAGNILSGTLNWSSSNTTVATVDAMGNVTARAVGTALIVGAAVCCSRADTATIDVVQNGGSETFANEPTGWTLVSDRPFATTANNGRSDERIGAGALNWFYSAGSIAAMTDQSGEPMSPANAYRFRFPAGFGNGSAGQQTGAVTQGNTRKMWVGFTIKSVDWIGHSSGQVKILWIDGSPSQTIVKMDGAYGNGPHRMRITTEHQGIPTTNTESGTGGQSVTIANDTWYRVEVMEERPASAGGTGRIRVWVNGTLTIDQSRMWTNSAIDEISILPYLGGVGGSTARQQDVYLGHFKVRVSN